MANSTEADTRQALLVQTLRVDQITPLSPHDIHIRFVHPEGSELPVWAPGDHVDVEFESGLTRQYSLCGPRSDLHGWSIAVRLDSASTGGSEFAHRRLRVGVQMRVAGPKGRFPLEPAPRYLLIAGGIGITPILSMAEYLAAEGQPFTLLYFERGGARQLFAERLRLLGDSVRIVDRTAEPEYTLGHFLAELPAEAVVYACGPRRMISELAELVSPERLRFEDFSPAVAESASPPDETDDGVFEVQLGSGGDVHPVPAGCSLLDVLLKAGVDVMWSCREGNCASCETPVLAGVPDHRDVILTDEEREAGDVIFPCVSRSLTPRLVLDV